MIIPVRCFTCGKLLCDKWDYFLEEVAKEEDDSQHEDNNGQKAGRNFDHSVKGKVLDRMGLDRICCRRHMLGHVDLLDKL